MREIKFRAWDVEEECWIPQDWLAIPANGMSHQPLTYQEDEERWIEETLQIITEQYTGLKDKNGMEIYEGDILTLNFGIPPRLAHMVVEYDQAAFIIKCWDAKPYELALCQLPFDDVEIIGNRHENPELLETP